MGQFIFFFIIILLTIFGVFLNRFLFKFHPYLLLVPSLTLLIFIGVTIYAGNQIDDIGALVYAIYLIVLIPIFIVVAVDAIILYIKNKRVVK